MDLKTAMKLYSLGVCRMAFPPLSFQGQDCILQKCLHIYLRFWNSPGLLLPQDIRARHLWILKV